MAEQSIRSLFRSAEEKKNAAEAARERNSLIYKDSLAAAIAIYEDCRELADRLSLFSPNETLEDIASGDLQYLLINYRLGDLIVKVSDTDRKSTLQKARAAYERYLSLLEHYGILSESEERLYQSYSEYPTKFSTISASSAEARRASKIANYNREKELGEKLEFLARNPAYLEQDDTAVRELHLTNLSLCTHATFQALETMNRELEILSMAPPTPPPGPETLAADYRERNGNRNGNAGYSDRLDRPISEILGSGSPGPFLSKSGKPLKPFTLLSNRQNISAGVFKPGHNLPTMTIDEYLEEEKRRGGIIEGGEETSGMAPEPDEDDLAKADEETMKARQWDEFVESNPKGSGNTLNRG